MKSLKQSLSLGLSFDNKEKYSLFIHTIFSDIVILVSLNYQHTLECFFDIKYVLHYNKIIFFILTILEGNLTLLREKVLSIPGHIKNVHMFPSNEEYKECGHANIDRRWVGQGSKASKILFKEAVRL